MLFQIVLTLFCFITSLSYPSASKSVWEIPGKNFHVDLLCLVPMTKNDSRIWKNTPVLSWCGNWPRYFHLLEDSILRGTKTVVLLPTSLFHQRDFLGLIEGSIGNFPGVLWLVISDHKESVRRETRLCTIEREHGSDGWKVAPGATLHCQPPERANQTLGMRPIVGSTANRLLSKRFRRAHHKIGRFADEVFNDATCTSPFAQSLSVLNASVQYVPINYPDWISTFIKHRMEAFDALVAYDLPRSRHLDYTGTADISHTVLYVKKKFKWSVNVASWKAGNTTLLVTAASAWTVLVFFCLLRLSVAKNPLRDIARVGFALFASIVSFPASFPLSFMSRQTGRLVLAFWVLSMMFLSHYIQALLTTSVSAGMSLDLDDTREKLSPKLKSQEIRVCAISGTYSSTLVSGGHGESEFAREMRSALDVTDLGPSSRKDDEMDVCLEKVDKGTHVFLTQSDIACSPTMDEKYALADENFGMRVVTFPVSKESPFKADFEYLTSRTFETGWRHYTCTPYLFRKMCYPAPKHFSARIQLVPQELFALYMHCTVIACVVLLLEILASGTFIVFPRIIRRIRHWCVL
ncbi:hypothetical protein HPB48_019632 [Haemaphysalis longicornis]|uniref:Ionotropic receptor n=1 Tax=Haemaphysalis longicornis TaxID=44386 RepID=A0A9J6GS27_HAELO|nr:hypothetical protein HPB48_019632 [Haemaphysalis longicornis]